MRQNRSITQIWSRQAQVLCHVVSWFACVRYAAGASYGGWVCTNTILNVIVSQGSFTTQQYAPFVSPADSVTECSQHIESYEHSIQCTYEFHAPAGHHIYVEFPTLALDSNCASDYVELHLHGNDVRRICGTGSARQSAFTYIADIFQTNYAKVTFTTNSEFRCEGFKAYFFPYVPWFGRRRRRQVRGRGISRHRRSIETDITAVRDALDSKIAPIRTLAQTLINSKSHCSICNTDGVAACSCSPTGLLSSIRFTTYKYFRSGYNSLGLTSFGIYAGGYGGGSDDGDGNGGGGGESNNFCICRS
ncbi:uncharacterized protein LOC135819591 [Sycon ciliatum]|uniref:uncharacterized protein LOC135819591 n=1 Tax=Sycon ciliatum TaxID=27933 RepID=UPI0031F6E3F0